LLCRHLRSRSDRVIWPRGTTHGQDHQKSWKNKPDRAEHPRFYFLADSPALPPGDCDLGST
jgi:hypothetical protein